MMEVKKDILWRVNLTFLGLLFFGILILGRAFYTQRVEGSYWKSMGDSLHTKILDLDAERGTIYSEDGSMLSTSLPQFNIYIDFAAEGLRQKSGERFFHHLDSLSTALAGLFRDKTPATYKRELETAYRNRERYYPLRKKVSFEEYKQFRDFPLVRLGRNKSGFISEVKTKRLNPFGELGFRTIGLYRENAKLVGLERSFDSVLRGTSGKRLVRFVAGGVMMPVEGFEVEPENGYDVVTTLDINFQDITHRALLRKMTENEALEGTAIVMEVATGKIKAMANLGRMPDGSYFEKDNYALRTSEPGSTIKLVTLLAALEDRHVTINDQIEINGGRWTIGGRTVADDHHGPQSVNIKTAFTQSSNVAMSKLAYQYYTQDPKKYYRHLSRLRLTRKTGIELNEEFTPIIKNPNKAKYWHPQTLVSWGFGYELLVSPLQLLMVYNAVANNGKLMKPYLVHEVRSYGNVIQRNEPEVLEEAIAGTSTIRQLQECLAAVCTEGTARRPFETALYRAAGKTGTAKVNDGTYKYRDGVYQSAFAGYFPADRPRYSIIVIIKNKPRAANYYGGTVSAPVFREIADHLYKYVTDQQPPLRFTRPDTLSYTLGGSKQELQHLARHFGFGYSDPFPGSWRMATLQQQTLRPQALPAPATQVPDVRGMGLKDALYLLEQNGLAVQVQGKGKVVNQSVAAGAPVAQGQPIVLYLN
ncbi:MAG TPA: penicillin-binding protein [Lacibacter sp.]|nr:penicillin-binding protein [Lacibacter sp.]HMO87821.1 penicillin-binding protein [Lacibacter sp.]HMP87087.1 penicillin-binding protein [Lacibacter sp.]